MEDSTKRRDHSDMEAVAPHDAPEVVPGSQVRGHVKHNSASNSPQLYTPPASEKQHYDYYAGQPEVRAYYEKPHADEPEVEKEVVNGSRQETLCGLRRKVFFWILGVAITVIVIAVVLGGVLGTVLGKSTTNNDSQPAQPSTQNNTTSGPTPPSNQNDTSSPPSIQSKTGLAAIIPDGTSTLYQYYQDEQGRIVEDQYSNGKWSIQGKDVPSNSIVGSDAPSGSPIAATSWLASGILFRQVFYFDNNGRIMSSNTTGANDWPAPYSILPDDSAMPGTKALAVVANTDTNALNGIRLYFASSDLRIIREVGMDFNLNPWTLWYEFEGSDPYSGIATALADTVNHVYLVNATTGSLQQWTWDYTSNSDTSWQQETKGSSHIAGKSDIAAVYDGISTDHIFYEGSDSQLVRALYYGGSISNLTELSPLASDSKISATYNASNSNSGATVFFQAQSYPKKIQYETINRSGQQLQSGVVT